MKLKEKTLEYFEEKLDVRHFVSMHKHLALLLWLLLDKKQLLLLRIHRYNAVSLKEKNKDADKISSSSSDSSDLAELNDVPALKLGGLPKPKKLQKTLKKLEGHQVTNNLDRKLLMGIFEKPSKRGRQQKYKVGDKSAAKGAIPIF